MQFRNLFSSHRRPEDAATSPYTDDLVHMLSARFGLERGESGAYIGAASTRLARLFLEHGHNLVATAARWEGRQELERLQSRWPAFRVVDGFPDRTGLAAESVDFILSERVLHLPNQAGIRAEFERVLRPGGVVTLITDNRVRVGSPQSEAYEALLRRHCPGFREKSAPTELSARLSEFFGNQEVFEDAFLGRLSMTLPALIAQTRSLVIFPRPADPAYEEIHIALAAFFKRWQVNGCIHVPMVCRVACGRLGAVERKPARVGVGRVEGLAEAC